MPDCIRQVEPPPPPPPFFSHMPHSRISRHVTGFFLAILLMQQILDLRLPPELETLVPKKCKRFNEGAPRRLRPKPPAAAARPAAAATGAAAATAASALPDDRQLPQQRVVYLQLCDLTGDRLKQAKSHPTHLLLPRPPPPSGSLLSRTTPIVDPLCHTHPATSISFITHTHTDQTHTHGRHVRPQFAPPPIFTSSSSTSRRPVRSALNGLVGTTRR